MSRWRHWLTDGGLAARLLRGSAWALLGYGGGQAMRFASNLVLTRLLFPEAFGLMTLVMVVITGLMMFSDIGTAPAIMQSKRGDDPEFLNTAYSLQILRGGLLWLAAAGLAGPVAGFYGAPELAWFLPIASLSLILHGLIPTRALTAQRHLLLGRVTVLDLVAQGGGILMTVGLAWASRSVWALVVTPVLQSALQLVLYTVFLPGMRNRLSWEARALRELMQFGKWIFLSTIAGFFSINGDRLVLGSYLSLGLLGIYNVGFFLASFPLMLGTHLSSRIMIPLYRDRPPHLSGENFAKIRKLRFAVTGLILGLSIVLSMISVPLVGFLYDTRYLGAGAVMVLVASAQIPSVVILTYDQAALASGDSRRFFVLAGSKAVLTIGCLLAGVQWAGLPGALAGQAVATLLTYPVAVWLARRQGAWDPLHDLLAIGLGALGAAVAIGLHFDAVRALAAGAIG